MNILAALGKITGLGGSGGVLTGGIGLSSGKSTTTGSGTSTTTSSGSQVGTSTSTGAGLTDIVTTSLDAKNKELLDALTAQLSKAAGGGAAGFTKADATADVAGAVQSVYKQFKEQELPQIFAAMGQAGAYNSTNAQLLANDALAEAIGKASTLTVQTVKDYAGITTAKESQIFDSLLKAFQIQSEATKTQQQKESANSSSTSSIEEDSTSTTNYQNTESTKSKSKSFNLGFKL